MTESSKNSDLLDIRVVVAVDFGTTFSGYGYAHKANPFDIVTNDDWPQNTGQFKTPTVLKYDESFNVSSWGLPALAEKPSKKKKSTKATITELFKLHLAKIEEKPPLPDGLDYKKAITDYLTQLGKSIKETINKRWPNIEFFDKVLLVLTIPAEYDDSAIGILRECAYNAGLLNNKSTKNLIFTTEPETAAIYCMKVLKEHKLEVGASFMVVDCGGGTVDLTTRELLKDEKLSEKTVRMGGFCGGSYVDKEFIKFVGEKVGENVIEIVTQNHYSQLQYMVQDFCRKVKVQFTGNMLEYETYEIDIEELCPVIKQYIMDEEKIEELEDSEWLIELTFEDVKAMFDPVVKKIVELIRKQLDDNKESECSAMFLVGGFSESKYLQSIIKKEFSSRVKNISVPAHPMTAIVRGAVMFGLRKEVVVDRRLKWNYGTDVVRLWKQTDPLDLRLQNGLIKIFNILAKKGKKVNVNESVSVTCAPYSLSQRQMDLDLYKTDNDEAQYCDKSEDVELLGKFVVPRLPKSNDYNENTVLFTLTFGTVEIEAKAVVESTGEKLGDATFELDL